MKAVTMAIKYIGGPMHGHRVVLAPDHSGEMPQFISINGRDTDGQSFNEVYVKSSWFVRPRRPLIECYLLCGMTHEQAAVLCRSVLGC